LYGNGAGGFSNVTIGTGVSFAGGTLSATGSGGTVTSVSGTGTVNGITLTGTVTSSGSLTLGGTLSGIGNSQLTNSTISGVALGGNLFSLTAGTGVSFSAGTTYNGSAAITINATGTGGTVTSVAALTLGTTGTDLSSTVANSTTTPVITLNVPTASAANRGALSAADWTTFNSKAPGVTFTTGYVPFGQGTTTLNQSAGLQFDGSNLYTQTVRSYNASANISYVIGGTNNGYVDNLKAAYYRLYVSGNAGGQSLDFQAYIQASGYASRMIIGPTGGVSIGNTTDPGATNLSVTGKVIAKTITQGNQTSDTNQILKTTTSGVFGLSPVSQLCGWQSSSAGNTFTITLSGRTAGIIVVGVQNNTSGSQAAGGAFLVSCTDSTTQITSVSTNGWVSITASVSGFAITFTLGSSATGHWNATLLGAAVA
jgi:hypothetical protein